MIVRNEEAIIARCLASVRPFISSWTICDTGSTDQTAERVRQELSGIPGELYGDNWVNFAHNRTLSIQRARGKADYHLLLDADMTLSVDGEFRDSLSLDAYHLRFSGDSDYRVLRVVSDKHEWAYSGVTHEHIHSATASKIGTIEQVRVNHFEDGSSRKEKYQRDIALLEEALQQEPRNGRYIFYLAQSYRDLGHMRVAVRWYEKRLEVEGWEEETWYSLYQIARLNHLSGADWRITLPLYLQAFEMRPTRAEPLFYISRFYRAHGQFHLAYLFARRGFEITYPDDILFVERPVYESGLPMELALASAAVGNEAQAIPIFDSMRAIPNLPEEYRGLLAGDKARAG